MKEIIVRTISGVLYIAIILFAMFTSRDWFMGLFFILATITLGEFLKLVKLKSYLNYLPLLIGFYFLSYYPVHSYVLHIYLVLVIFVNIFLFKNIMRIGENALLSKRYVALIFYIIGGFVFLTLIPGVNSSGEFMSHIIISVFVLIWANDTFAYLVGRKFGKNKLLERISPKKTIEGFFGGFIGALLISVVVFFVIDLWVPGEMNYNLWVWMCLAVIISVTGTVGDLIQSQFKRQAGVKDSGIIMPGHGGMYDRLDSIIYASPFVYAFLLMVNYVS